MGLFDEQVESIRDFISQKKAENRARELDIDSCLDWPLGSSLILEEDTALELGNPGIGSLSLILWQEGQGDGDRVLLIGPDLNEIREKGIPFCQIVLVRGSFSDEYDCWREIREAVYETKLKGFMVRVLPSRQDIWCRVNREALAGGLSFGHIGAALVRSLREVDFVSGAEVIFVTSGREDVEKLKQTGYAAGRIVSAMMKMVEEMNFDCEGCDYREVCERVEELKRIRMRLKEERGTDA